MKEIQKDLTANYQSSMTLLAAAWIVKIYYDTLESILLDEVSHFH